MSKAIRTTNNTFLDSSSITHNRQKLSEVLNKTINIIDVTESQNGRYITSKIPFNTNGVLFFILEAVSAWSSTALQVAFFRADSGNVSIFGAWESSYVFPYHTIFEIVNDNQLRVKKYAQGTNITSSSYNTASDMDVGAIRPNKIYAVTTRKDL